MKKTKIIGIALSVLILGSCASSSDVVDGGLFQKRKYNKGWSINKKAKVESDYSKINDVKIASVSIKVEKDVSTSNNDIILTSEQEVVGNADLVLTDQIAAAESIILNDEVASATDISNNIVSYKRREIKSNQTNRRSLERADRNISLNLANNTSDSNNTTDAALILLVILAIFIPPLAVAVYEGITTRFWIDLLLTFLFFFPGMIYALLIVLGGI